MVVIVITLGTAFAVPKGKRWPNMIRSQSQPESSFANLRLCQGLGGPKLGPTLLGEVEVPPKTAWTPGKVLVGLVRFPESSTVSAIFL